jgi:hypothetical protein
MARQRKLGYVLVAFFNDHESVPRWPAWRDDDDDDEPIMEELFGVKLLHTKDAIKFSEQIFPKPVNTLIGRWAVDYVTTEDCRWLAFGPFATEDEAERQYARFPSEVKDRDRHAIVREDVFHMVCNPTFHAWTDG